MAHLKVTNSKMAHLKVTNSKMTNLRLTNSKMAHLHLTNSKMTNLQLRNSKMAHLELTNSKMTHVELTNGKMTNIQLTNSPKITASPSHGRAIFSMVVCVQSVAMCRHRNPLPGSREDRRCITKNTVTTVRVVAIYEATGKLSIFFPSSSRRMHVIGCACR